MERPTKEPGDGRTSPPAGPVPPGRLGRRAPASETFSRIAVWDTLVAGEAPAASGAVGLVSGIRPARRAVRLDPVDGLRHA